MGSVRPRRETHGAAPIERERRSAIMTRESLHRLVDQVDDDTAEELLEFAEWLLQEQQRVRRAMVQTGIAEAAR